MKRPSSACYSDRFIPSRAGSGDFHSAFELLAHAHAQNTDPNAQPQAPAYDALLRAELLDACTLPVAPPQATPAEPLPASPSAAATSASPNVAAAKEVTSPPRIGSRPPSGSSIFRFHAAERPHSAPPGVLAATRAQLGGESKALLGNPSARKVARVPFKVLDAPCLKDDFYLNLVDWSAGNVLAVGLGNCVYLWSAHTSVVTKLCELKFGGPVCSVSWNHAGDRLAVGTSAGLVQVWDAASCSLVRTLSGHTARVGCLAWSTALLSSGGRDFDILNRDLRAREPFVSRWAAHRHEVCGLRWSPDDARLASGGNDNRLLVWSAAAAGASPVSTYDAHQAAVKAIAWSPHQRGLLASGGGTQDKQIRFWNVLTDTALAAVDTGSQVCNLAWSKNVNELVSTHGYSQNQIVVWKYPSLSKVATLTGHAYRVLYLAVSPGGETIVTGAGDETLRFWNVFPSARGKADGNALLSPLSRSRMSIR